MAKIRIDDSGITRILDVVGGRTRKVIKAYFFDNFTQEQMIEELYLPKHIIDKEVATIRGLARDLLVKKVCGDCGKEFYTARPQAKICPVCNEKNKKAQLEQQKESHKKPHSTVRHRKTNVVGINEIIKQMTKYNKEYKTRLSYGQYVALVDK